MFALYVCVLIWDQYISTNVLTEALYEKKESVVTYAAEVAKLQAQVEKLESAFYEKGICVAEYEAMVKKSEGAIHNHEWNLTSTQSAYIIN